VPPGVVTAELDRDSGQPATDSTPPDRRYTEYFLDGTQPGALRNPWSLWQWGPVGLR
jgi:penicillin-binding protein 1A